MMWVESVVVTVRTCDTCYDKDVCGCGVACSHYSPLGDEAEDAVLQELVESERDAFREAWFEYVSDYE